MPLRLGVARVRSITEKSAEPQLFKSAGDGDDRWDTSVASGPVPSTAGSVGDQLPDVTGPVPVGGGDQFPPQPVRSRQVDPLRTGARSIASGNNPLGWVRSHVAPAVAATFVSFSFRIFFSLFKSRRVVFSTV